MSTNTTMKCQHQHNANKYNKHTTTSHRADTIEYTNEKSNTSVNANRSNDKHANTSLSTDADASECNNEQAHPSTNMLLILSVWCWPFFFLYCSFYCSYIIIYYLFPSLNTHVKVIETMKECGTSLSVSEKYCFESQSCGFESLTSHSSQVLRTDQCKGHEDEHGWDPAIQWLLKMWKSHGCFPLSTAPHPAQQVGPFWVSSIPGLSLINICFESCKLPILSLRIPILNLKNTLFESQRYPFWVSETPFLSLRNTHFESQNTYFESQNTYFESQKYHDWVS